jgi:hypothetical protein
MTSLVSPQQISSIACHKSFEFSSVATFSSIFSFALDLSTRGFFFVFDALGFLCFPQGLLALAFEKLQHNEKKTQLSLA